MNVSFWTETGSNYAKKLEGSQDSKALPFILPTEMHLCSPRQCLELLWAQRAAQELKEQDIKVGS